MATALLPPPTEGTLPQPSNAQAPPSVQRPQQQDEEISATAASMTAPSPTPSIEENLPEPSNAQTPPSVESPQQQGEERPATATRMTTPRPTPSTEENKPEPSDGQNPQPGLRGHLQDAIAKVKKSIWPPSYLLRHTEEHRKEIIENSLWPLMAQCSLHIIPIAASIALAVLNIQGHFIGNEFAGAQNMESVNIFFLQFASKIMELLIVASISIIVLDIIRYEVLEGKDGLPFGLLGSYFAFRSLSFLASMGLWYGTGAISTWRRQLLLPVVLVLSCLLATFAGPSAALLMIPTTREFPGGGSDFWLIGSETSFSPSKLNADAVGGEFCLNATPEMIRLTTANYSGCIWSSTSAITEVAKSWRMNTLANTLTIGDANLRREVLFRSSAREWKHNDTWALSSSYAVVAPSTRLSWIWSDALFYAPIAVGKHSRITVPERLRFRNRDLSVAKVTSELPIVRVRCFNTIDLTFGTRTQLTFPLFDYYSTNTTGLRYKMEIPRVNSSSVLTQWIPIPQPPFMPSDPQGDYPSTFLTIQVPQNTVNATVYTCAVDARWVNGEAKLSNAGRDSPLQTPNVTSESKENWDRPRSRPIDDGSWRQVSIDLDWLYALTPLQNNPASPSLPQTRDQPGRTSLSVMLMSVGFDNSTSLVRGGKGGWDGIMSTLETIIAVLVAEGMARIGQADESFYQGGRDDENMHLTYDSLLKGDSKHIYNPLELDASNGTMKHWSVTVSGHAYSVNGKAYYLAFAVLLLHAVMAIIHIIVHLWWFKGSTLNAWTTFEGLMVLSHNSRPNHEAMKNTSSGIISRTTLARKVKIRVVKDAKRGEEEVQLLLDTKLLDTKVDGANARDDPEQGTPCLTAETKNNANASPEEGRSPNLEERDDREVKEASNIMWCAKVEADRKYGAVEH